MQNFSIIINNNRNFPQFSNIEVVERKGIGHPDTLAGLISESSCIAICKFFIKKYGIIPRFNIDQVEINGGDIDVDFLRSKIIKKGIISISGKISYFNRRDIKIINRVIKLEAEKIIKKNISKNIVKFFDIKINIGVYSIKNKLFFENKLIPLCEDTSLGIGFYPYTNIETLTLDISHQLDKLSNIFPIGRDNKVMIVRRNKNIRIIISTAFLSTKIKDIDEYFYIKKNFELRLENFIKSRTKDKFELIVNNADNKDEKRVYITLFGTGAEHDKGSLARGNSISGLITPYRPASFEVIYGKNPVYNASKLYNLLARYLAQKIVWLIKEKDIFITVQILSALGNRIDRPEAIFINISRKINSLQMSKIEEIIRNEFGILFKKVKGTNYTVLTKKIIEDKYKFYEC